MKTFQHPSSIYQITKNHKTDYQEPQTQHAVQLFPKTVGAKKPHPLNLAFNWFPPTVASVLQLCRIYARKALSLLLEHEKRLVHIFYYFLI